MFDLLTLAFGDAIKALNLTNLTAPDAARMVANKHPDAANIAPEVIAEALKSATYWRNQGLKLSTSTMQEQPTLTSTDRRRHFEQSQKWEAVVSSLSVLT